MKKKQQPQNAETIIHIDRQGRNISLIQLNNLSCIITSRERKTKVKLGLRKSGTNGTEIDFASTQLFVTVTMDACFQDGALCRNIQGINHVGACVSRKITFDAKQGSCTPRKVDYFPRTIWCTPLKPQQGIFFSPPQQTCHTYNIYPFTCTFHAVEKSLLYQLRKIIRFKDLKYKKKKP